MNFSIKQLPVLYATDKWYDVNKKFHRLDGPAVEYNDGTKFWYYHGQYIECSSQKEFERFLKLKAFW
jgi:hypothetical protein